MPTAHSLLPCELTRDKDFSPAVFTDRALLSIKQVSLAILYVYGTDAGWRWEEFRNDIFAWPWSIIMNIIFAAFHINAWMGKKRYGLNSTSSAGVRSDSQPRGFKTDQISAGQHILNIQLECAYPPTLSKDSEVIGEALDDAAEQQQKQESHEKQRYPWD